MGGKCRAHDPSAGSPTVTMQLLEGARSAHHRIRQAASARFASHSSYVSRVRSNHSSAVNWRHQTGFSAPLATRARGSSVSPDTIQAPFPDSCLFAGSAGLRNAAEGSFRNADDPPASGHPSRLMEADEPSLQRSISAQAVCTT